LIDRSASLNTRRCPRSTNRRQHHFTRLQLLAQVDSSSFQRYDASPSVGRSFGISASPGNSTVIGDGNATGGAVMHVLFAVSKTVTSGHFCVAKQSGHPSYAVTVGVLVQVGLCAGTVAMTVLSTKQATAGCSTHATQKVSLSGVGPGLVMVWV